MKTIKNSFQRAARNKTLGQLGERGFIQKILPAQSRRPSATFVVPPGDDAVVLKNPTKTVLSIDGLTEGTHFRLAWNKECVQKAGFTLGRGLGWKLLGCSLSDLAAMGAVRNRWAMIYLGAPGKTSLELLEDLQRGVKEAAEKFHCALAGGDTVKAKDISLVAAVGGQLKSTRPLLRSGAQPGDLLCIAGTVGDASMGLKLLDQKMRLFSRNDTAYFIRRFFQHEPLFSVSEELAIERGVTSLIDLSDALKDSIEIICNDSSVGASVYIENIPVSSYYSKHFANDLSLLTGGEDYSLLFTLRPSALPRLRKKVPFAVVGFITDEKNRIRYRWNGKIVFPPPSFQHFS